MVKRPDEMRWAIVRKWKSNLTISAIAKEEGCAKRTAKLWIDRYQASGGVKDLPRSGRRPCMDEATQRIATDMLLSDNGGATAVSSSLVTSGATPQPVHKSTIIRTARRVARAGGFKIKALRGKPTKRIPAVTVQKRLGFCVKNLARTWGNKKNASSIGLLQGWPPNSPDLSLIENVWAILDAKMDSLGLKTFSEYKAALVREAKAVPKEVCQNLFAGMHKWLQSCMERGGQKTMH
jgi:transposase